MDSSLMKCRCEKICVKSHPVMSLVKVRSLSDQSDRLLGFKFFLWAKEFKVRL